MFTNGIKIGLKSMTFVNNECEQTKNPCDDFLLFIQDMPISLQSVKMSNENLQKRYWTQRPFNHALFNIAFLWIQ